MSVEREGTREKEVERGFFFQFFIKKNIYHVREEREKGDPPLHLTENQMVELMERLNWSNFKTLWRKLTKLKLHGPFQE